MIDSPPPLLADGVEYQYVDLHGSYIAIKSLNRINHVVQHIDTPPFCWQGVGGNDSLFYEPRVNPTEILEFY